MNRKLLCGFVVGFVLCIGAVAAVGSALTNVQADDSTPLPNEELVAQVKSANKADEAIKEKIAQIHDAYNDILGWRNYEQFTHEKTRAEAWEMYRNTGILINTTMFQELAEATTNEAIKEDLLMISKLIGIAAYHEDVEALFYIHRILHDLDYWVFNGMEHADYYGATLALDGGSAQKIHWFVENYE